MDALGFSPAAVAILTALLIFIVSWAIAVAAYERRGTSG